MKFATRINSFKSDTVRNVEEILDLMGKVEGLDFVDLNYPEHFEGIDIKNMQELLARNGLKLNGVALRFRDEFIRGELGNADAAVAAKALDLCKEAVDVCRDLGGEVVTIWLGYDGYDYSFQMDYVKAWKQTEQAFREVCDYGRDLRISIEYKPFQPRVYSLISSWGSTMSMLHDVGRDNLGITLDFCHMLMKNENPAFSAAYLGERGKLYGVHLNDGAKFNDDGLMIGMVNFIQTLEFIYYLKRYRYDGVVYFDTFPVREDAMQEVRANIRMMGKLEKLVERIGMEEVARVIQTNDAIEVQKMICNCF